MVKKLVDKNNEVIVFDNEFRGTFDNLPKEKIRIIKGDIRKFEDWQKIPDEIELVYHFAAINGTEFFYNIPEKVLEVNVKGIINCLDFIIERKIPEIFFASSSEVYGFPKKFPTPETEEMQIPDPLNPRFSYSGSKMIGELLCINYARKYGFKWTIVRYHNIYGPKMGYEHVMPQFIKKLVKNEKFEVEGDGTESRCFCFIDDAIEESLLVQRDNSVKERIFNIGNPEENSIKTLIQTISKIAEKDIIPIFKEKKQAGTKRRVPDISKVKQLGFEPKINLEVGLRKTFEWYEKYYSQN